MSAYPFGNSSENSAGSNGAQGYSRAEISDYLERHPQISYHMLNRGQKDAVRRFWGTLEDAKIVLGLKHPTETRARRRR
jgi:hypothetical protein